MSEENVEVVRQVFEAFNSRDWAAWESHHHRTSSGPTRPSSLAADPSRGVRRFMDDVLETGDEWHVEVDGIESVGEDRVLMWGRSVLVGHASRIPMEDPLFQLFDLKQGRVSRVQTFRSSGEALEATGLSE